MATTSEVPGYLSTADSADFLGVSDSLVRRWIRDGRLPHVMAGEKTKLVPLAAVKRFAKIERKVGRPISLIRGK